LFLELLRPRAIWVSMYCFFFFPGPPPSPRVPFLLRIVPPLKERLIQLLSPVVEFHGLLASTKLCFSWGRHAKVCRLLLLFFAVFSLSRFLVFCGRAKFLTRRLGEPTFPALVPLPSSSPSFGLFFCRCSRSRAFMGFFFASTGSLLGFCLNEFPFPKRFPSPGVLHPAAIDTPPLRIGSAGRLPLFFSDEQSGFFFVPPSGYFPQT